MNEMDRGLIDIMLDVLPAEYYKAVLDSEFCRISVVKR
jgi:hypothetical protein